MSVTPSEENGPMATATSGAHARPTHEVVLRFDLGVGPTWGLDACPYPPDDTDRPCRPTEPGFEDACTYQEWWDSAGQDQC